MPRAVRVTLAVVLVVLLIGGPLGYSYFRHQQVRNLRVVRDGVLLRSGQLSRSGLERVLHDYGVKTVITLRDAYYADEAPPDADEEEFCKKENINYYRISPRKWWSPDGSVPAEEGVRTFWEVMDNPANFPVLIHCLAGIHRTGAFCAIYRMEYEGWTNEQAIGEMRALGYKDVEDEWDLLGYLEHYKPRSRRSKEEMTSPAPGERPVEGRPTARKHRPHNW
jgi:protein tyrosine/serine phosphatase